MRHLRPAWLAAAGAAGLAVWIGLYPADWQNWLGFSKAAYFTNGQNYAFASGVGPMILTAAGLSTIIAGLWKHLNCRADRCRRLGHYHDSRGVKWCWEHHPDHHGERPTAELLHRLHFEHLDRFRDHRAP